MQPGSWSIVFLFLMMAAIILELLTPSMGGFTVLAIGATIGSVVMGFKQSDTQGYVMIAANLVCMPITLWLGVKYMKRSPLMLNREITSGFQESPDAPPLAHLLGKEGKSLTPLRPGGAAMIGQIRIDVMAQGKFVEAETPIRVIHVEGSRVVVEPIEQAKPLEQAKAS
jgi:membrane-bound ClpP family serine protease